MALFVPGLLFLLSRQGLKALSFFRWSWVTIIWSLNWIQFKENNFYSWWFDDTDIWNELYLPDRMVSVFVFTYFRCWRSYDMGCARAWAAWKLNRWQRRLEFINFLVHVSGKEIHSTLFLALTNTGSKMNSFEKVWSIRWQLLRFHVIKGCGLYFW